MTSRRLLDVLIGSYVSFLIVTTSALIRWEAVEPVFTVEIAVGIGLVVAVVVTLLVGTIQNLSTLVLRLLSSSIAILFVVTVGPIYIFWLIETVSTQAVIAFAGIVGTPVGVLVIYGVAKRVAITQQQEISSTTTVTVGTDDESTRRQLQVAHRCQNQCLLLASLLTFASHAIGGWYRSILVAQLALVIGGVVAWMYGKQLPDSSTFTLTEIGLWMPIKGSFVLWDRFDGYRVTTDEIQLVSTPWLGMRTETIDREEITDEERLLDELSTYLPRLNETGEQMNAKIAADA